MKPRNIIFAGALIGLLAGACASKTRTEASAPVPEPPASSQTVVAEICTKMTELHQAQTNAHEQAAQINDAQMQASMASTLKVIDDRVADMDARVEAKGIVCP